MHIYSHILNKQIYDVVPHIENKEIEASEY